MHWDADIVKFGVILALPLTVTVMVWCVEPNGFLATHLYFPESASETSMILRVFLKFSKNVLLMGSSPPSLIQRITGVGLEKKNTDEIKELG